MVDLNALNDILSVRNGVWGIFGLLAIGLWHTWKGLPAVMQQWIAHRQAKADEKQSDWRRLRDEVQRLAESHIQCERNLAAEREARHLAVSQLRDELAAERAARIKLQAKLDGRGEVQQAAAVAAAEQRLEPERAPEALKAAARLRRMGKGEEGEGI